VLASATRLVAFSVPALYFSRAPGFELESLWHLSVTTVVLQALMAGWWARRELTKRLQFAP
jgi:Na+-driven multidrug efflux pump